MPGENLELPVLIACRHYEEYFDKAKQRIDHYFGKGYRTIALETYPGRKDSTFFEPLREYAEGKGMNVVPLVPAYGGKRLGKAIEGYFTSLHFAERIPSARKTWKQNAKEWNHERFVIAEMVTKTMVKRLATLLKAEPKTLIMVGFGHDAGIRKAFKVKYETIGWSEFANLRVKYHVLKRKVYKAAGRLKRKFR